MTFGTFLVSIFLTLLGATLLFFLLRPFLIQIGKIFRSRKGQSSFQKTSRQIEQIDTLIENGEFEKAATALRKAVTFEIFKTPELATSSREHHQNILSRCVILSEEIGSQMKSLPQVEHLFFERAELMILYEKASSTYQRVSSKRENVGKAMPDWSKEDFKARERKIREELIENEKALTQSLDQLFEELKTQKTDEGIVYH